MYLFWSLYFYLVSHPKITALRFCAGLKDTVKIPIGKYDEKIILNRTINCLLYTNVCTNKYCKLILNYPDMFRVNTPYSGSLQVVLAKVVNH
jgi:hypothetical protein